METKVLSFRMPRGWPAQLSYAAREHGFTSRGEMLRMAITEAAYLALQGKLKVKRGNIEAPTEIITCRLPVATLEAIRQVCCKQVNDSSSVWAALAVYQWYQALQKEDNKQQRHGMYGLWLKEYGRQYRNKVAVYNIKSPDNRDNQASSSVGGEVGGDRWWQIGKKKG